MSEVDRELLLSVTGGLGGLVEDDVGKPVYCKDEDCLGEPDWGNNQSNMLAAGDICQDLSWLIALSSHQHWCTLSHVLTAPDGVCYLALWPHAMDSAQLRADASACPCCSLPEGPAALPAQRRP